MQIFILLLLGYILYRFIVGFVLPVVRTTRTVKKQFEQMRQQQAPFQSGNGFEQHSASTSAEQDHNHRTTSGRKGAKEDYIDFEEVPSSKQ